MCDPPGVPDDSSRRAAAALARHDPGHAGYPLQPFGSGLDNTAFLAGDLVVRVRAEGSVTAEARLLRVLAGRVGVPVPAVAFVDDELGVLAYPRLPGTPLLGRAAPAGLGAALGGFLGRLHALDAASVSFLPTEPADPAAWLEELTGPDELLAVVRGDVPEPSPVLVPAHADLGAEHLLARDGELTGVIDWSDAVVTDPALDVARPLRDFGPAVVADLLRAYDRPADPDFSRRVEFFARCAALEDLAYGEETGRRAYADAARASFAWLFPGAVHASRTRP